MWTLNHSVRRQLYPLPTVDVLSQLCGANVFFKLYTSIGFWQISLAPSSRHLTTFLTPFRCYHFNKLPFGLSSVLRALSEEDVETVNRVEWCCLLDGQCSCFLLQMRRNMTKGSKQYLRGWPKLVPHWIQTNALLINCRVIIVSRPWEDRGY